MPEASKSDLDKSFFNATSVVIIPDFTSTHRAARMATTFSEESHSPRPCQLSSATPKTRPVVDDDITGDDSVFTIIGPREVKTKRHVFVDEDEPLVDTTEAIPLKSKKTERRQKKRQDKLKRTTVTSDTKSFLELPTELLQEVLGYLRPSDIFRLLRLNKATSDFILEHESTIVRDIIRRRYWTLARCFQLPVALRNVQRSAYPALLSPAWQQRTRINKGHWQHVQIHDEQKVCSCMSCILAWNNLCLLLDLAHFQKNLSNREPLPMIPRGTFPEWNRQLLEDNALIVERAIGSPLHYAMILQVHLSTIAGTLTRQYRVGKKTFHPRRLYHISPTDVEAETDEFLERSGPPSYEFPVYRDKYYSLEAYVPNRKWSKEEQKWLYYGQGKQHDNDINFIRDRFTPNEGVESLVNTLARGLRT